MVPSTKVNSYCGVVAWFQATYANEEDCSLTESRLGTYRQSPDKTPRHIQERLVATIGHLKDESEIRGQFISSISCAAHARLIASERNVSTSWEGLVLAAEAGDIQGRSVMKRSCPKQRSLKIAETIPPAVPK